MESIFYSEEEMAFRDEARAFFEREARPFILSMERENMYPFELLRKMGQQHYIGVRLPSEYGGGGRDMIHETIVNEEAGAQSYAISCARSDGGKSSTPRVAKRTRRPAMAFRTVEVLFRSEHVVRLIFLSPGTVCGSPAETPVSGKCPGQRRKSDETILQSSHHTLLLFKTLFL